MTTEITDKELHCWVTEDVIRQPHYDGCKDCGSGDLTQWRTTPMGWSVRFCRVCFDIQRGPFVSSAKDLVDNHPDSG